MQAVRTVPVLYGCASAASERSVPHRPELVSVVEHKRSRRRTDWTLVTAFAGKWFCLADYLRGIRRLPLARAHAIWYDNCNDAAGHQRLRRNVRHLFDSYTLVRDRNPQRVIETSVDYAAINTRIAAIYDFVVRQCLDGTPTMMIVEDDVEVPAGAYERLSSILARERRVAVAVGNQISRRLADGHPPAPIVWNFETTIPCGRAQLRLVPPQPFGVQLVGSSHTGCWLGRSAVAKELGFQPAEDGVEAVDAVFGYRANKRGYWFAIDWSVRCKHYYQDRGRKRFV